MATKAKKRKAKKAKWLVFVDTNIFLDFYRLGGDSAKRALVNLEQHSGSLILTDQVWMEFLKNRQKVILQTIKDINKPSDQTMPALLNDVQAAKQFTKYQKLGVAHHKKLIQKIEAILKNPSQRDPVYKSLQKLFALASELSLKRPDKRRYTVRRAAMKRFSLGYPPRKDDTLRLGDSINWEWIIECANASKEKANILIVSRDGDFGANHSQDTFLNDWLRTEFKERVSRQRKIELTNRLSTALKRLDATVRQSDVEEEDRILRKSDFEKASFIAYNSLKNPIRDVLLQDWLMEIKKDKEKDDGPE
jgi:predicted nucleic acid-binding protein